jgi:hypothetical protein
MVNKIISGTGVDRALDFAIQHIIPHGGWSLDAGPKMKDPDITLTRCPQRTIRAHRAECAPLRRNVISHGELRRFPLTQAADTDALSPCILTIS